MKAEYVAIIALAILAGSAGYIAHQYSLRSSASAVVEAAPPAATVQPAPNDPFAWSFNTPEGGSTALSTWRGKVLVINFWATWCPPCLKEIPIFIDLQRRHAEAGLQFVGIALDQADAVLPFMQDKAVNYPVLVGDQDVARFMQALGNDIGGLPYTVVISRDGVITTKHRGEWTAAAADAAITPLLIADQSADSAADK